MKKLNLLFLSVSFLVSNLIISQNPYASLGKKTKPMLSLSNGKYVEHFENDSIRQIGSVMVNMRTEQIIAFVDRKEQSKKNHSKTNSRFLSVDPLARQFPWNTPYSYAENRPINGIDLEGREFSKSITNTNDGKTLIQITVKVNVNFDNVSPKLQEAYKKAIQEKFSQVISSASGGNTQYSGEVQFDTKATINITAGYKDENTMGVGTSFIPGQSAVYVGIKDKNGEIKDQYTAEYVGEISTHELFHQIGISDIVDTEISDVKLTPVVIGKVGKYPVFNYKSGKNTVPNVSSNVMTDGNLIVDGKKVEKSRGKDKTGANTSSSGQMKVISENIDKGKVNGEALLDQK